MSGCLLEALQDEQLFLPEKATDASEFVSIFVAREFGA
jgi:hypothetical protein